MGHFLQSRLHASHRSSLPERLLPAFDWLAPRPARPDTGDADHLLIGNRGEEAAFFYLRRLGWIVVARQWRSRQPGDLDLVAWDGDTLCFVEVKTRTSRKVSVAESSVDADKRRMIRRMARLYLKALPEQPKSIRFDILTVYLFEGSKPDIRLIPAAFGWSEPAHRWN
jgi:putative endonuclease